MLVENEQPNLENLHLMGSSSILFFNDLMMWVTSCLHLASDDSFLKYRDVIQKIVKDNNNTKVLRKHSIRHTYI